MDTEERPKANLDGKESPLEKLDPLVETKTTGSPYMSNTADLSDVKVKRTRKTSPAKRVQKRGYKVDVKGQYFCSVETGTGSVLKSYEIQVNVSDLIGCLSIIKNEVLPVVLAKKDPNFIMARTYEIIGVTPFGGAPEIGGELALPYMDRKQMEKFIASEKMELDPDNFSTLTDLRTAIEWFIADPIKALPRVRKLEEKSKSKQTLVDLNPDLDL